MTLDAYATAQIEVLKNIDWLKLLQQVPPIYYVYFVAFIIIVRIF